MTNCNGNNNTPVRCQLSNKNHSARHGVPPYELWVREAAGVYQTTQAITIALGYQQHILAAGERNQSQADQ